ncbi:hypothetical protein [Pseudomonas fluorescens]|uniref:hypothetical protein n=1 Tax=Pseudomonas fluorescens TaxID=294 RepID=UPI003D020891
MQLMRPQDHSFFSEINKAIYIYFVSLTSVFVRPDGAKLWGMTPEGVIRYQLIHVSKLDHRNIHSRWCEIECHRAGVDIWVKHYEDEDVQRSIRKLTEQTSVDVSGNDCYYAAIQVNFYMPSGGAG